MKIFTYLLGYAGSFDKIGLVKFRNLCAQKSDVTYI